MCNSAIEVCQSCAAHSRPRYQRTRRTSPEWLDAARDYASTPEGQTELTKEAEEARRDRVCRRGEDGQRAAPS